MLGLVTDDKEALSYWKASLGSNRIFYQYEAVYLMSIISRQKGNT